MTRIIALSNQKGGVGKTTTSMNLSTALAATGKKVLVIDLDPQANSTSGLGVAPEENGGNSYTFLMGQTDLNGSKIATPVPNLDLIPSTIHLSGAEVELVPALAREYKLQKALEAYQDQYDYIFIDCAPSLGLLTINALVAAKEVMVPMQCEYFAMEGISQLFQTIEIIKKSLNPDLRVLGVLLTMYDKRNKLSKQVEADVREHLGESVLSTVIPRNVRLSEAPSHGKPGLLYDVNCAGSQAYIKLASEVIKRHTSSNKVAA